MWDHLCLFLQYPQLEYNIYIINVYNSWYEYVNSPILKSWVWVLSYVIRHHHGITGPHKGRTEGILYFSRLFVWRDQQSKRCQASSRSCPSGAAGAWREGTEHSKWSNHEQDWCFGCGKSSWKIKMVHQNTLTLQKKKCIKFQIQHIYINIYIYKHIYI